LTALAGRIALVTGASRGIGKATAIALARAGAHVVMTARTQGGLIEADDAITAAQGSATIAPLDLMDGDGIDRLGAAIGARWGRLDVLVLNAAMLGSLTPIAHADPKDLAQIFALNVLAQQRLLRACDPWLRAAPAGHVIGLTSTVATRPRAYWGPYAASKAAFEALLLAHADEVSNISGVRVAILNPGPTATVMRANAYPGEDAATLKRPEVVGERIARLLAENFETGVRVTV
jgi:NAD(P)-dependent dehydrogenase (short-subunit alcohol dehydrogenase family)